VLTDHTTGRRERERTRRLFNRTAPYYWIIDRGLVPRYRRALAELDLPPDLPVLDVATGTGALALAFDERGHPVTGIDFAVRLLSRASRRVPDARFELLDLVELPRFADASFGIVSFAYVLHGLSPELRAFALAEARRIASRHVVVFDYSGLGPWYVRLVERVEGPHYRSFVATSVTGQLAANGLTVDRVLSPVPYSACWLCFPAGKEQSR
jgi:ubiquinone/menaquinone biosynthesis C-methylase UbiE